MDLNPSEDRGSDYASEGEADSGRRGECMAQAGASGTDLADTLDKALVKLDAVRAELHRVQDEHGPYEQLGGILKDFDEAQSHLGLSLYGVALSRDAEYMARVREAQEHIDDDRPFDDAITMTDFIETRGKLADG